MTSMRDELCDVWDRLVPSDIWLGPETLRQASRVAAFDLAMLFWVIVFAPIYVVLGALQCAGCWRSMRCCCPARWWSCSAATRRRSAETFSAVPAGLPIRPSCI